MTATNQARDNALSNRDRAAQERAALVARLWTEHAGDLANKLEQCGATIVLLCTNCGARKPAEVACRRRWCPACAWGIQQDRIAAFEGVTRAMTWPLFVTLTMPNDPDPTRIRVLRDAWARMRRRKLLQDRVTGGITTIEITEGAGGWHPHLHCLCDCRWLSIHTPAPRPTDSKAVVKQKCDHARMELSAIWSDTLKVPQAIVLAKRKAPGDGLAYATKYGLKGTTMIQSKLPIAPLIRVIATSRLLSTFGNCHAVPENLEDEGKTKCTCKECGATKSYMPEEVAHRMIRGMMNAAGKRK